MKHCLIYQAGLIEYVEGLKLQKQARDLVIKAFAEGIVILQEHYPTITIGKNGGANNLCHDPESLRSQGIEITITDRGGNISCHNPGQLVVYPIINLVYWKMDVNWYVNALEEVGIKVLREFGVKATRKEGCRGVWVGRHHIAAVGISVKSCITGHGFSLNIANDLALYNSIVPCGIADLRVTNLSSVLAKTVTVSQVAQKVITEFRSVFACSTQEVDEICCVNLGKSRMSVQS